MSFRNGFVVFGLFLSSTALANPAQPSSAEAMSRTLTCQIEAGYEGQIIEDSRVIASMTLNEDGQEIRAGIFGTDPQYEVLIQYYLSEMEDDKAPHERIEVAINDTKKGVQEDYISSKLKSMMYISALEGSYDRQGRQQKFDTITIECHPSN